MVLRGIRSSRCLLFAYDPWTTHNSTRIKVRPASRSPEVYTRRYAWEIQHGKSISKWKPSRKSPAPNLGESPNTDTRENVSISETIGIIILTALDLESAASLKQKGNKLQDKNLLEEVPGDPVVVSQGNPIVDVQPLCAGRDADYPL